MVLVPWSPDSDGYRGLLYVTRKGCYIRSKRGNHLKRFDELCHWVREELPVKEAILDGEVVSLGARGFVAYVRLGVLAANLLTLARHQLA